MLKIDSIKSKIKKLYNLSKSSNRHESQNAKDKLDILLNKYGIKIEDVVAESIPIDKQINCKTQYLFELLVQIMMKILCVDNTSDRNPRLDKHENIAYVKLTDLEYAYVKAYYDYYEDLYVKELVNFISSYRRKIRVFKLNQDHFKIAFYIKHKLFANLPPKENMLEPEINEMEREALRILLELLRSSDEFRPHKMIA